MYIQTTKELNINARKSSYYSGTQVLLHVLLSRSVLRARAYSWRAPPHSLTYVPTHFPTHKKKKKKKKLTHSCIVGDKIAHLYIQMSFPHFIHIPTFYPQSFPHFWGSYPHFSGTFPHVFHIFWRVFHIFLEFPTFYKHSHMCIYS